MRLQPLDDFAEKSALMDALSVFDCVQVRFCNLQSILHALDTALA
jgi:hypothetical protein